MDLRLIEPESREHRAELDLRYRILRAPLGRPPGSEWYAHEAECVHAVAMEGERVLGCVLFHGTAADGGRLLQMAVEESEQGRGIGRQLVRFLEAELARRGVAEVILHAREHAVGFYERLGYETFGAPFSEVGLAHQLMRRDPRQTPPG